MSEEESIRSEDALRHLEDSKDGDSIAKLSPRTVDQIMLFIQAQQAEIERFRECLKLLYDHCRLYHPQVETNNVGREVQALLSTDRGGE